MIEDSSPSSRSIWSLSMAVAWVMWRKFEKVDEASSWPLLVSWFARGDTDEAMNYGEALGQILRHAGDGDLPVTMVHQITLELVTPSPEEWAHLSLDYDDDLSERFTFAPSHGTQERIPRYRSATVRRADIVRLWPTLNEAEPPPENNNGTVTLAIPESSLRKRNRIPQDQIRVRPVLARIYPNGVPDRSEVSDAQLVKTVGDEMKTGVPSKETILRAAGRINRGS